MALWLAERQARHDWGHDASWLMRFDPRYWSIDFPRPMIAALTTPAPDALRVDARFLKRNDLTGLIWASEDTLDHPLLSYATDRDYAHCELRFRWRSSGVLPLDAVNGPTLTIEGRDALGAARTWYVRLWNYAEGTPEDAMVRVAFCDLAGGFVHPEEADPVFPGAIDRIFVSLVPAGFDGTDMPLTEAQDAWVELSEIRCDGRAMVALGDAWLPEHGAQLCTAYDDSYNQAPARILRGIRQLGYGQTIVHYIGMSHYFPLTADGDGFLLDQASATTMAGPALAWHRALFAEAQAMGLSIIGSLSFEVLAMHCPAAWQQRDADGAPALTGWEPPSALLSPANSDAVGWLCRVAGELAAAQGTAGLPVRIQIGEPWWWVTQDGRICLYDDAAVAAFGGEPPVIADMRQTLGPEALALLDQAGVLLGAATAAISQAVSDVAGEAGAEMLLLAFLPTVLDPATPEAARANLPSAWAYPAFDVLQTEDYDWLTTGRDADRRKGRAAIEARLGYPIARQHYLSGFVLRGEDAERLWPMIDATLDEAAERGVTERFVWAYPQVCRDGYVRLPSPDPASDEDNPMQSFDDVLYPIALGREAAVLPEFSTTVTVTASGHERRNSLWSDARMRYDVGPGIRSDHELGELIAFFRARRGMARGFRLRDPSDFSSSGMTDQPGAADQLLGIGDGKRDLFELVKHYGVGDEPQTRRVTRPRVETVRISIDGVEQLAGWTLEPLGTVRFEEPPANGSEVRAGFAFDVPVRFAEDRLEVAGSDLAAGEAPSVPLIEIREIA